MTDTVSVMKPPRRRITGPYAEPGNDGRTYYAIRSVDGEDAPPRFVEFRPATGTHYTMLPVADMHDMRFDDSGAEFRFEYRERHGGGALSTTVVSVTGRNLYCLGPLWMEGQCSCLVAFDPARHDEAAPQAPFIESITITRHRVVPPE